MKTFKFKTGSILSAAFSCILLAACLFMCSCSLSVAENGGSSRSSSAAADTGALKAHFLDVGQGDSIFIELPDSKCMLIDAGVSGLGESIVSYIEDCGYSKVDYLVATHPHADHIGSMAYVVSNIDIGEVYMPKVSTTTKTYENLLTAISDKGLSVKSAKSGMSIIDETVGESCLTADVLAPVTIDEDELNNCSVVIKLCYGDTDFLFIGDAETDELETITADLSAQVLKVGHHGSRTSTTRDFLEKVMPEYAVISLGEDNSYGHPHESTIELLNEFNVKTYRTDEDKTVTVSSDGKALSVETSGVSMESGEDE